MNRTVAIHSLGCKVNSYEAESMEQLLKQAGYTIVPFDENITADIYIINTCSVTNIADRKSRQMLHKSKKINPDAIVVAAGCYVNADTKKAAEDNAVDIVLGNNCKINIVEALENYYKDKNNSKMVVDFKEKQEYEELKLDEVSTHTRAYIKIQDGCNQFCSYCIIPYTRGRIRSRDIDEIEEEVTKLVSKGFKEVVLTGIHLTSYGVDNNKGSLLEVIMRLDKIDGLQRIRLGSLEPRVITEEFAKTFSKKQMEAICHAGRNDRSYLDLWRANRIILEEAGVQPQNISVTNICTRCNPDLLYSHRIMGAQRGNLAAILMIRE